MTSIRRSLSDEALASYVCAQLNSNFPDNEPVMEDVIRQILPETLKRLEFCFSKINNKYFFDGTSSVFSHLHGDQYAMFLYLLSNTAHRQGASINLSSKIFLLNKMLHGIDAFYEVTLPDIFLFVHPLGTVLGRAKYSDYLVVYQRCGIGSNHDVYPTLGEFLTLHPGTAILGNCTIASNCTIATESLVLEKDLAENSLYIGNPKSHFIKTNTNINPIWRI